MANWGRSLSDRLRHRENVQARIRHELTCSLTPYQIWTGFSYLIFSYFGNSVNSSDAWAKTWTSSSQRIQKDARTHGIAFCSFLIINFWLTVLNFWVAIFILNNKARRILEPSKVLFSSFFNWIQLFQSSIKWIDYTTIPLPKNCNH